MLVHMLSPLRLALNTVVQDIVILEYLDQRLVYLIHHIPCWSTGYLKIEAQTLEAFASMASTAVALMCLAWTLKDTLGWRSDVTMGC